MTLIRKRSAGANGFELQTFDNDEEDKQPPSKESVVRAEVAKRFLEQNWKRANERYVEREDRTTQLKEKLSMSQLSEEEKERIFDEFSKEENEFIRFSRKKLRPDDYNFITLIGRGGFADVWLVTNKQTQEINALKIIRKKDVILCDQVQSVKNERDILAAAHNPWIVNLSCSFQDEEHLYLVLEFVQGGDLMNALIKYRIFTYPVARFFCGEILLAIHSIHELGFVHSDLKPDNILITTEGHIKLTDFGIAAHYGKSDREYSDLLASSQELMIELSKPIMSANNVNKHRGRNEIIGSVDYTAPEVLSGHQRTFKSDWWSFGIILYEMLFGFTPFASNSARETAFRIINWRKALRIPAGQRVHAAALDLLKHLLCDEKDRYDYEQIVAHSFFAGFNFVDPLSMTSPLQQTVRDPLDTSYFDSFDDVKKEDLRASATLLKLADFVFKGFSYKAKPPSTALKKLGIQT